VRRASTATPVRKFHEELKPANAARFWTEKWQAKRSFSLVRSQMIFHAASTSEILS
jgi:hypothetical protein